MSLPAGTSVINGFAVSPDGALYVTPSGTASITGGTIGLNDGAAATPSFYRGSDATTGLYFSTGQILISISGTPTVAVSSADGLKINKDFALGWTAGDAANSTVDTKLARGSAGVIKFASANSFSANGSVATVLGSVGPTGSHTTVQKWLTIQDNGAVVGYIPVF